MVILGTEAEDIVRGRQGVVRGRHSAGVHPTDKTRVPLRRDSEKLRQKAIASLSNLNLLKLHLFLVEKGRST